MVQNMGLISSNFKYMSASHPIPCLHLSSLPSDSWRSSSYILLSLLVSVFVLLQVHNIMGISGFKKRIKDEISPQKFHIFFSNIFLSSWTQMFTGRNHVFVSPSSNILSQIFPQPSPKVIE